MSLPTRFLVRLACPVIARSSMSGIAYSASVAVHAAGASGIGWDGGTTVTTSPRTGVQGNGIGWD
jgi:hypothetical protein